jgi:uncharacterized protein
VTRRAWFEKPRPIPSEHQPDAREHNADGSGEDGLRFACTMCGNCCTGPTGYVKFTETEAKAIAARLGIALEVFYERYARHTLVGMSLREVKTTFGYDCVFLDRDKLPGKAVCSLYEDRPEQCRTWPFWSSNLSSERAWKAAAKGCPGIGSGPLYAPEYIRVTRDKVEI